MAKRYFTSPEIPAPQEYSEILDGIFTDYRYEAAYGAGPKVINDAQVMVTYQLDDDAYACWTSGNHYSGITYDSVHGVFLEQYYPNARPPYLMRYHASEPHLLTDVTKITERIPESFPVDSGRERVYRHGLNDMHPSTLRTALTGNYDALQESAGYRMLTGSKTIAEFIDRLLSREDNK